MKRTGTFNLNGFIDLANQSTSTVCAKAAISLILSGMVSAGMLHAATIPFTFAVVGGAALTGPPIPDTPIGVMLFASSASFTPFGSADYSEEGLITFTVFPSGAFAPISVENTFTASFNGGADTFFGTDVFLFSPPDATGQITTNTMTVLGGTGIFGEASGFATGIGTNSPPPPGVVSYLRFSSRVADKLQHPAWPRYLSR